MVLRFTLKQKAQLSLSFLPIGDTPVQRFYIVFVDYRIHRNDLLQFFKFDTAKLQRKFEKPNKE